MKQSAIISDYGRRRETSIVAKESKLRRIMRVLRGETINDSFLGPIGRAVERIISQGSKTVSIEQSDVSRNWIVRGD